MQLHVHRAHSQGQQGDTDTKVAIPIDLGRFFFIIYNGEVCPKRAVVQATRLYIRCQVLIFLGGKISAKRSAGGEFVRLESWKRKAFSIFSITQRGERAVRFPLFVFTKKTAIVG